MKQAEAGAPSAPKPLTIEVAGGVHALLGPVNSLIIEGPDSSAVLIDSGQDGDAGRRIRKALDQLGLTPTVILNTHSHADHFGGNAYLLRRYPDIEVLAPEFEANIIRAPYLEPVYLFHGASPLSELRSKWLQAPASPVHREVEAGDQMLGGVPLTLHDVRGHSHRQLAVQVGDLLFASDAVFGPATLARYPLPFAQDVSDQLAAFDTLTRCLETGLSRLLPGHGELTLGGEAILDLIETNRAAVRQAAAVVLAACEQGAAAGAGSGTEDVLAFTARELGLEMNDLPRYHLNLCTVSAYLSHLRREGAIEPHLVDGRLQWRPAP